MPFTSPCSAAAHGKALSARRWTGMGRLSPRLCHHVRPGSNRRVACVILPATCWRSCDAEIIWSGEARRVGCVVASSVCDLRPRSSALQAQSSCLLRTGHMSLTQHTATTSMRMPRKLWTQRRQPGNIPLARQQRATSWNGKRRRRWRGWKTRSASAPMTRPRCTS